MLMKAIVRKAADFAVVATPTCGELREILQKDAYEPVSVALAIDIKPTKAHFHRTFDEIYFMLDGSIDLELFDPGDGSRCLVSLEAGELCVIPRGKHHRVTASSDRNRLCVLSAPAWQAGDETLSEILVPA